MAVPASLQIYHVGNRKCSTYEHHTNYDELNKKKTECTIRQVKSELRSMLTAYLSCWMIKYSLPFCKKINAQEQFERFSKFCINWNTGKRSCLLILTPPYSTEKLLGAKSGLWTRHCRWMILLLGKYFHVNTVQYWVFYPN